MFIYHQLREILVMKMSDAFKVTRVLGCDDGEFIQNKKCLVWLQQFTDFLEQSFPANALMILGSYCRGSAPLYSIELFSEGHRGAKLTMTVILSKNSIFLPAPDVNKMDIWVPGIADVTYLIGTIIVATNAEIRFG